MPLGSSVGPNIKELTADNKKSGKARGANGKVRPRRQIVAIALNAARKAGAKIPKPKKKRAYRFSLKEMRKRVSPASPLSQAGKERFKKRIQEGRVQVRRTLFGKG